MSREEAAAKGFHGAMFAPASIPSDWTEEIAAALSAADAWDAANGVHRVTLGEDTIERAARAMYATAPLAMYDETAEKFIEGGKPWDWLTDEFKDHQRKLARAVLAAAVQEGKP